MLRIALLLFVSACAANAQALLGVTTDPAGNSCTIQGSQLLYQVAGSPVILTCTPSSGTACPCVWTRASGAVTAAGLDAIQNQGADNCITPTVSGGSLLFPFDFTCFTARANTFTGLQTDDIGYRDYKKVTAPSSPASGYDRIYADTADGQIKCKDSAGASCFAAGTSSKDFPIELPVGILNIGGTEKESGVWGGLSTGVALATSYTTSREMILSYPEAGGSANNTMRAFFRLPSDWTAATTLTLYGEADAGAGSSQQVIARARAGCTATVNTSPTFGSYVSSTLTLNATTSTAFTLSGIALTGCSALSMVTVELNRDSDTDTSAQGALIHAPVAVVKRTF
jgi:hypothetical protein